MARFHPIEQYDDLPQTSAARESLVLDFKVTVDPKAWWELAKDIAAFANHVGGTLVVGADEPAAGAAPSYSGLSAEHAERVAKAYEDAVLEHCLPHPVVRVIPIDLPSARKVVAVNVEPFPDQPVGAQAPALNKNGEPKPSDAWQFPMRVGRDTRPLTPDQLPLLTNAAVRRNVILLERIPNPLGTERVSLIWRHPGVSTMTPAPTRTALGAVNVDVLANLLRLTFGDGGQKPSTLEVPLDDVETAWHGVDGWMIRVRGFIDQERRYVSNPACWK